MRRILGREVPEDFPVPHGAPLAEEPPDFRALRGTATEFSRGTRASLRAMELILEAVPAELPIDALLWASGDGPGFDHARSLITDPGAANGLLDELYSHCSLEQMARMLEERKKIRIPPGERVSSNNACVSGNVAIGQAMHRIRAGHWKRALVGGACFRSSPFDLMSLNLLGALSVERVPSAEASCPFSMRRAGYVKAEAAALFLLEDREVAERRGAKIWGAISGFGHTSDAYRLTDGLPDSSSAAKAMELALLDAKIDVNSVDYINAHGTSTRMNDFLETQAIKKVFGKRAYEIPVSSLKSQIGHASIAAGTIEMLACLLMLQEQKISPTINYFEKDPECDLDYVPNSARAAKLNCILSNSFGFGGQNACIVIRKV
ncbi:MAG: beta-ketoacyl-[acyl-carrier-protein] synthase family protein [Bdellovibrionota bacterium]